MGVFRYHPHMNLTFNIDLFLNTFDSMCALRGVDTQTACREAGVAPPTLSRLRGKQYLPYVPNMAKLLLWMSEGQEADLLPYMTEEPD